MNGHRRLSMHTRARTVDLKLIFVPLIFLLLRIWNAVIDVPVFYLSDEESSEFTRTQANAALVFLAVSLNTITVQCGLLCHNY